MSAASGQTGRGFSRLDWVLLVIALILLGPFLFQALTAWVLFLGEMWELSSCS